MPGVSSAKSLPQTPEALHLHAGDSWDVAEAIVYVASQAGKFITGEVLNVDGGQQCWGDPWFAGRPPYFELDYPVSRQGPA